ncbi:MAG: ribosomal protein S18-alanine N-acetyltransferase [Succinivibrio sp.]
MSSRFSTRILTRNDLNLVKDMEVIELKTQKNAWNAQSLIECFDDSYLITGLFDHEKLIGFSVIYNTKFTTDLLTIGVTPEYQGKHLGQKLLFDTLKKALEIGDVECFLEVRVSNTPAINLYTKFGFQKVGLRKEYYNPVGNEKGEDAYTMHLSEIGSSLLRIADQMT